MPWSEEESDEPKEVEGDGYVSSKVRRNGKEGEDRYVKLASRIRFERLILA